MHYRYHMAISAAAGAVLWALTRSVFSMAACLVSGTLLDADHLPDYLFSHRVRFSWTHFMDVCHRTDLRRIFLIGHSWELVVPLVWAGYALAWHPVVVGALTGFVLHMLADQLLNGNHPLGYFFLYRALTGFSTARFSPNRLKKGSQG